MIAAIACAISTATSRGMRLLLCSRSKSASTCRTLTGRLVP
jgi:hypothetical protein